MSFPVRWGGLAALLTVWLSPALAAEGPDYVGGAACGRCHAREKPSWAAARLELVRPQAPRRRGFRQGPERGAAGKAVAVLEAHHRRHREDRDILYALALFSRELGRREAASDYAERFAKLAPDDP
jgi:hypothetical protein